MKLIDVHCHVQLPEYDGDREAVIQRSLAADIGMIVVGTTMTDSVEAVRLAEKYPSAPVYAAVGVHPTDSGLGEIHPAELAALLANPKVVAVGETGLDYFRLDPDDQETRQEQRDVFEQHLLTAIQSAQPVIVHTRDRNGVFDAYDDTLVVLRRHQVTRFVMHCYSGDWTRAEQFLELGGYLSLTGILTFPKADMMQDVARRVPLDKILVETDAPFLAPVPHRGERNEPAYVQFVAEKIAELRGVQSDQVIAVTTASAEELFQLT